MDNLNRRKFMKIAGIAIVTVTPMTFLKAESQNTSVEENNDIEFELHFPYSVYNAETRKCWDLDMENPADRTISFLINCNCLELVNWESFRTWSIYCKNNNLKVKKLNFKDKTSIDILCDLAFKGKAMLLFEEGKIKAIIHQYSEPCDHLPSTLQGREINICYIDDSPENKWNAIRVFSHKKIKKII